MILTACLYVSDDMYGDQAVSVAIGDGSEKSKKVSFRKYLILIILFFIIGQSSSKVDDRKHCIQGLQ